MKKVQLILSCLTCCALCLPIKGQTNRGEALCAILREESFEQSFDMLLETQQYFPGVNTQVLGAQTDLGTMLSTRRSVKLLESLERLPRPERIAQCEELFAKAFQNRKSQAEKILRAGLDLPPAPSGSIRPEVADGNTRMQLCFAVFATADCGDRDLLSKEFGQLDQLQSDIGSRAEAIGTNHLGARIALERYLVPDRQAQVNFLRVAAWRCENAELLRRVDEEIEGSKMLETNQVRVFPWDAGFTKGSVRQPGTRATVYINYSWLVGQLRNAESQEKVVQKLRQLVTK